MVVSAVLLVGFVVAAVGGGPNAIATPVLSTDWAAASRKPTAWRAAGAQYEVGEQQGDDEADGDGPGRGGDLEHVSAT